MIESLPWPYFAALLVIIWAAAVHDLFTFRIPHVYTYLVLALLLFVAWAALSSGFSWERLPWSALGGLVALILGFMLYAIRVMGAGDVKLFAAMAPLFVFAKLPALFACIAMAGLVWVLVYVPAKLIMERGRQSGEDAGLRTKIRRMKLPYGPAIALGTTAYIALAFGLA